MQALPENTRRQLIETGVFVKRKEEATAIPCPIRCPEWTAMCQLQAHDDPRTGMLLGLCNEYEDGLVKLSRLLVEMYDFNLANLVKKVRGLNSLEGQSGEICQGLFFLGFLCSGKEKLALILTASTFALSADISSSRLMAEGCSRFLYLDLSLTDRGETLREASCLYASFKDTSVSQENPLILDAAKITSLLEAKKEKLSFRTVCEGVRPYQVEVNNERMFLDQKGYEELVSRHKKFDFLVDGINNLAYSKHNPDSPQRASDNEISMLAEYILKKEFIYPGKTAVGKFLGSPVKMFARIRKKITTPKGKTGFKGFEMCNDPNYLTHKLYRFKPEEVSYCLILPAERNQ